jgi:hypothetical protein
LDFRKHFSLDLGYLILYGDMNVTTPQRRFQREKGSLISGSATGNRTDWGSKVELTAVGRRLLMAVLKAYF